MDKKAFEIAVLAIGKRAAQTLPQTNGRLDKAVELVLGGAVELHADGTATIASQSNDATYTVNGRCDCPDAQFRAPRGWCKHKIAWAIATRAWEQRARDIAERNGWTVEVLGNRLLCVLCGGLPTEELANEATELFRATERVLRSRREAQRDDETRRISTSGGSVDIQGHRVINAWCGTCKTSWPPQKYGNRFECTCGHVIALAEELWPEECGCVIDTQSCPVCRQAAREAYGDEIAY